MSPLHRLLDRVLPPTGLHRGPRAGAVPERIEVPLSDLLGPPLPAFAEPPAHGAAVTQGWRHCPPCDREEPSLLHPDGSHTCGHCFTTTTTALGDS